jgi:hydroxyethylthiazole kinase-like uncharacterized protein yjeF
MYRLRRNLEIDGMSAMTAMNIRAGEEIDEQLLRRWPLPKLSADGDKKSRGRLLIVAGSAENPGGAVLAADAALRAGAGKLTIATVASRAVGIAMTVPEARVIDLPENSTGGIAAHAETAFGALRDAFDTVLIGPGMLDEYGSCEFARALAPKLGQTKIILDAAAMASAPHLGDGIERLITPHAGEMAHLCGVSSESIEPAAAALALAAEWRTTVALKGSTTVIGVPSGRLLCHRGGNVGLAVSGSGDVLAGIIAGLAARGATLEQAAAWGVFLHARAGVVLAGRSGPVGFLPREISGEIPALLKSLCAAP